MGDYKVTNIISTKNKQQHRKKERPEEDDALLVITLNISHCTVKLVLIDIISVINFLFRDAFDHMRILHKDIEPKATPLIGFTGRSISLIGNITLLLTIVIEFFC